MISDRKLWGAAILLFGFGDVVTTLFGFSLGAIEFNPSAAAMINEYGVVAMFIGKVLTLLLVWMVWFGAPRVIPGVSKRMRWVAPVTLAVIGTGIVIWNATVIIRLL